MITDMKQYGLKDRILVLASMYLELTVGRIVSQKKDCIALQLQMEKNWLRFPENSDMAQSRSAK